MSIEQMGGSRQYIKPKTVIGSLSDVARKYLHSRGLNDNAIAAYRIGCTEHGEIAIPFFDENDVLQLVKFRHPEGGKLDLGDRQVKTFIEKGGKPILLGSHLCHNSEGPLVISFGDYDALALYQSGIPNVTSLPFGDKGHDFIKHQWEFLDSFAEVILFPDKDDFPDPEAEQKAKKKLEELAQRLGMHRTRIVRDIDRKDAKDPNELLLTSGPEALQNAIENAIEFPVEGLIKVADYKDSDFEQGRKTGYPSLDRNIGGFFPGNLIIIGGENGSGKTTTVLNMIAASVDNRVPVLNWSGEQRVGALRYWFERIVAGPDHLRTVIGRDTGFKYYFPHEEKQPFIRDWYRDYFFQYTDFFTDAEKFFTVAEVAIRRYGCGMIVIDNLMAFTGGEGDGYYQAQGDFVQSCKMFAEKWAVTVILIAHNRKDQKKATLQIDIPTKDDLEGSKKISNWADVVLQLYRIPAALKHDEWDGVDGVIALCKCRESGKLGTVKTIVDHKSNRILEHSERDFLRSNYRWYGEFKTSAQLPSMENNDISKNQRT